MLEPFPDSLLTSGPVAGHELACRLAERLAPGLPPAAGMAAHLRTNSIPPGTREIVIATYFHAITVANRGWSETERS